MCILDTKPPRWKIPLEIGKINKSINVCCKKKTKKKHEQLTTINKEQFRPHITENIGLTEQQKIVMVRDRSTPTQDMSPERLTQPKKKGFFFLIKPTLH